MARADVIPFDSKARDARGSPALYPRPMIRTIMNRSDWGLMLSLALIWGVAFFFIGVAVRHVPTFTYVWLRTAIAAVALLAYLRWRAVPLGLPRSAWGAMLVLALLNNVIPFALFGWSQTQIASGLASILNATTPIWGVLVAHGFTRDERLSPAKLAGVTLGFGGVAMMVGPGFLDDLDGSVLAQLACIVATLCYAVAGVYARRFKALGLAPESVATGQLTAAALIALPFALAIDQPWALPMPPLGAWGAIVALALLCSAAGYVLYFRLIDSAGATNALLVTLLVPPTAILLGVLFLNESIAPREFAGMGLIALGLAAIDGRIFARLRTPLPA